MDPLRDARRIVIKVGSAMLVDAASGCLRTGWLAGLAEDIAALKGQGRDVLVVSSGSIALGRQVLRLASGVLAPDASQAAAAVGQIRLARAYEEALALHDLTTAQILLTLEDSANRRRYLNARGTLAVLLNTGAVPIINENDTVATDEIRFGDNDRLAAQVAAMAGADVLVLLSDVDGLYTANPQGSAAAAHLAIVTGITPEIEAMAGGAGTDGAKGGMKTKLMAARTAMQAGCAMAIMEGTRARPITALAGGAPATWFLPRTSPAAARKQWIASMKPCGILTVDAGAVAALRAGKSLLPAGVCAVAGEFRRGDPVTIAGPGGEVFARGLVNYPSAEAVRIAGARSGDIAHILGYAGRATLVHRDDMVL
ncbi:MAG: glutamate 5-kinase [Rhodobacteraceae bacterium]|nr:glutamate 5-kinase [Paracoccaceae bacterium]